MTLRILGYVSAVIFVAGAILVGLVWWGAAGIAIAQDEAKD
jgi:hypothetical protein